MALSQKNTRIGLGLFTASLLIGLFALNKYYWIFKLLVFSQGPVNVYSETEFSEKILAKQSHSRCTKYGEAILREAPLSLAEASGVAPSLLYPDSLYHVNDSGNEPLVHLRSLEGKVHKSPLSILEARDLEAMDAGPCGRHHCIYVADTGSNNSFRTRLRLSRFREGVPNSIESLELKFSGEIANIEALAVHPQSGDIFLLDRDVNSAIYRVPASTPWRGVIEPQLFGEIFSYYENYDLESSPTGAAFAPDGKSLFIITSNFIIEKTWPDGDAKYTPLPSMLLPEAITVLPNGSLVFTSEMFFTKTHLKNFGAIPCLE